MNVIQKRYLAETIYNQYVLATHIYSQEEYQLLEVLIKIPVHTFKSADYPMGYEIVTTISFDNFDDHSFREFILDPVEYLDHMNEIGALNIDSIQAHGFEVEYNN